ncbi:MAG: hypothetical protein M0Z42_07655 [Actinomycetota bacterium]|nr:hypothetical protein [Actinomycetota bacterium]
MDRHRPLRLTDDLPAHHRRLAARCGGRSFASLEKAVEGADVVIGVSRRGAWDPSVLKAMTPSPIVSALANPDPGVLPDGALLATGRSDLPNQVNNALCFPGILRGALDARARRITPEMQRAAAAAIADSTSEAERGNGVLVPSLFHAEVHHAVVTAVEGEAAR